MPIHVPHEPVIYVAPVSNHGVLFAVVMGALVLAAGTFAYAVSSAQTPAKSAKPAGPPPAPPERSDRPSVKLGTPHVESGAAIEDADQVIRAMSGVILRCYEQALGERKSLHGDFSLRITVTPSSTEIRVRSSELPSDLVDCIQESVRSFSFAPQPGTTLLRVDGTLKPPDPPPCGCAPGDPLCTCL